MTIQEIQQYVKEQQAKNTPTTDIMTSLRQRGIIKEPVRQPTQGTPSREILPTIGAVGGGIAGTVGGGLVGGPAGAVAGGIAGAGAGGALGEYGQQKLEQLKGTREKISPGQIATTGITTAATEGIFKGAGAIVKPLLSKTSQAAREPMIKFVSKLSGYADDVVKRALERTPGAVGALKQGEKELNNIVINANTKIQELASAAIKEAKMKIKEFSKLTGGGVGAPGTRREILKEGSNFVGNTIKNLREQYNIGVNKLGGLDFNRPAKPSNIVSSSDQSAVKAAFDTLGKLKNNTTIENIDAIFERLITLKTKTPGGTPTGGETKKIISGMIDELQKFVDSSASWGKGYSDYSQFLKGNLQKRVMIEEAKDLFGTSRHLSPTEISQITKKLLRIYNTGEMPVREAVEQVSKETGEDIVGGVAGTLIKTGKEPSIEVTMPTTRNIMTKLTEGLPRTAVKNYIETGKITGELLNSKPVRVLSSGLNISAKSVLQFLTEAGLLQKKQD